MLPQKMKKKSTIIYDTLVMLFGRFLLFLPFLFLPYFLFFHFSLGPLGPLLGPPGALFGAPSPPPKGLGPLTQS